ncbi:Signal transduction histidine kinase [Asanoa hainanensis]|uniref:Oxygen sensor histidine kinase NreB n=1 Tax=Asanoa hainanensis TaxID=560556 RepID=A0A239NIZ5_9ACTN|nr:sensor histidine kinase [Asanoa hainanensis]SNT54750.1 Signal transduction histidine kinase [Asanoa hainanensis]
MLVIAPYASLAGATLLAVVTGGLDPVALALVAATAAWLLWWVTVRQHAGGAFFVGLVLLSGALVWRSPLFGFFAWTGYLFTVTALRGRWRLVGTAAVAVLTAAAQARGFGPGGSEEAWLFAVLLAFNVLVAVAMTHFATVNREQQAKLAEALAENAGLHSRLLAQARAAGVHDERQRLAGELHDVLAQGLTGIVTQLEAAGAAADRPVDWRRHVDTATRLARDSLTEARRSVHALGPGPLAATGLPAALGELVEDWSRLTGVRADLVVTGAAGALVPEIEATLLRAAQEALTNVARHARAGRVALSLSYLGDLVTLDVRDDGIGFDPQAVGDDGGFGLSAMRNRVARVAGTLEVESEPGDGTAIAVCVPAVPVSAEQVPA